jgi:hypothetical protein
MRGSSRRIVNIDFGKLDSPLESLSQSIQNWFQIPAVPSPWCSKIDYYRPFEVQHLALKGGVGNLNSLSRIEALKIERLLTLPTFQPVRPPGAGHAVFGPALWTNDNH